METTYKKECGTCKACTRIEDIQTRLGFSGKTYAFCQFHQIITRFDQDAKSFPCYEHQPRPFE